MQLPKYSNGDLVLYNDQIRQISSCVWASSSVITGQYYKGWIYTLEPLEPGEWYTNVTEPQLEPMFTT